MELELGPYSLGWCCTDLDSALQSPDAASFCLNWVCVQEVGGEGKITLSSKILMFFSHVEIHS